MSSYAYGGDPTGLVGSYHYGGGGLGVLGSEVPATGVHGGGFGYKSLSLPADADKEYCFPITSVPPGLTITADEFSGFAASANDGTYVVPFDVIENTVNIGSTSFSITFGAPAVNLMGSNSTQGATSSTGVATVTPPAPGVVNLAGSNSVQGATCSKGAITLAGSAPGTIPDASTISASRTVVFGGGTNRVNFGGGTNRVNF